MAFTGSMAYDVIEASTGTLFSYEKPLRNKDMGGKVGDDVKYTANDVISGCTCSDDEQVTLYDAY